MMASPYTNSNCSVFVECATGMGDLLFDIVAGVVVARRHGCPHPTVFTHWYSPERAYDFSRVLESPFFRMAKPVRIKAGPGRRAWPGVPLAANGRQPGTDVIQVAVTFPSVNAVARDVGHAVSGCGQHSVRRWTAPLLPGVSTEDLVRDTWRIGHSICLRHHRAFPADIHERVVMHVRRGDKLVVSKYNTSEASTALGTAAAERW